ncbi:MAG: hypothetical protein OEZ59_02015 [Deltaproteobacteria bacterium]|nr:hypothetical protein [Deltaproteobacteria bacterium]
MGNSTPARRFIILLSLFALLFTAAWCDTVPAREIRRSIQFIRPLLMGGAQVALGDEASTLFYNPAGIARLGEGSVEIFTPMLVLDERVFGASTNPSDALSKFEGIDMFTMSDMVGTSVFAQFNMRSPVITDAKRGNAYIVGAEMLANIEVIKQGELTNPLDGLTYDVPALHLEFYTDYTAAYVYTAKWGSGISLGIMPKSVSRLGIDKIIDAETLFGAALGGEASLINDSDYQAMMMGMTYHVPGLDAGLIITLPWASNWRPRIGYSILNIGGYSKDEGFYGMRFGKIRRSTGIPVAGELPLLHTVGIAVSPTYNFIRYTAALDIVDVTRQVLENEKHWTVRTRAGLEIGIGPEEDGAALFSFLAGWNAGHTSAGVLSRVWIFEIGMGRFTVEKGYKVDDDPDSRRVFLFGFRW